MNTSYKSIKLRLFLTCWLVFSLHFATDFVREHYLVLSIVEDFSFRLDKYADLHPDIFQTPKHGAHHGANPGASMIAAIPYFALKPAVDAIVNHFPMKIKMGAEESGAGYKDNRPARVRFFNKVHSRGLEVKFGLAGFITMVFCMAPLSALSAIVMFWAMNRLGLSQRQSVGMALLYGFGTPVFFRTAYLNQNLMVGIFAFIAFVLLWNMSRQNNKSFRKSIILAGFFGGLTLLCDYSGLIPLFMLFGYSILCRKDSVLLLQALKDSSWYLYGALVPLILLWLYQWSSFGYPFYPPQYSMPPQIYSDVGYQGIRWPSAELFWMFLFDYRFGLFVISPILLLAFCSPVLSYLKKNIVPFRETVFILCFFIAFVIFFSFIEYTRLQWVTGIRYIVPVIPFLFLLTAALLARIPRLLAILLGGISILTSWAMSMARRGVGVPEESMLKSIESVMSEGLQLPWLNTISKMSVHYMGPLFLNLLTPVTIFILSGLIIFGIWKIRLPSKGLNQQKVRDRRLS